MTSQRHGWGVPPVGGCSPTPRHSRISPRRAGRLWSGGKRLAPADPDGIADSIAARQAMLSGAEALAWFDRARTALVETMRPLDPSLRVPWYGPDMSVASSVTARIMETWAHGQDIVDGLGGS